MRSIAREPFAEHLKGFKRQQDYLDTDITRRQMEAAGFTDIDVDAAGCSSAISGCGGHIASSSRR